MYCRSIIIHLLQPFETCFLCLGCDQQLCAEMSLAAFTSRELNSRISGDFIARVRLLIGELANMVMDPRTFRLLV